MADVLWNKIKFENIIFNDGSYAEERVRMYSN